MDKAWTSLAVGALAAGVTLIAVWFQNRHAAQIARDERDAAAAARLVEREDAADERRRRLRTATRLVIQELDVAVGALQYGLSEERWWWEDLPRAAWEEHSSAIAGAVLSEEWALIRAAFDEIERIERVRRTGVALDKVSEWRISLERSIAKMEAGVFAMQRYENVEVPSILPPSDATDGAGYRAALHGLQLLGEQVAELIAEQSDDGKDAEEGRTQ